MPGAWYRKVLNDAFGPGGWGLQQVGRPVEQDGAYYMDAVLVCHGRVVAETVGEYLPEQKWRKPGKGTVWESLCTDAISKCCKTLGVAEELWFPAWCRKWQADYAEQYVNEHGKRAWRRKDQFVGAYAIKEGYGHESEFAHKPTVDDENRQHLAAIGRE